MFSYYSQLASSASISALLAIAAYALLIGGDLVLTLGAAMGLGGIAGGYIFGRTGSASGAALLVAAGVGAAFMASIFPIVRRMSGFVFAITTVAIAELVRVVVENQPVLGGALGYRIDHVDASPVLPVAVLLLIGTIAMTFDRSPARGAVALVGANPRLAVSLGISPTRIRFWMMTAAGAVAGTAGGLYVINLGILDPSRLGFEGGIQIVLFGVIGGTRLFIGPVAAAVALTVVPELLRVTAGYRMLIYGALLVAVMILRPAGRWRWKRAL